MSPWPARSARPRRSHSRSACRAPRRTRHFATVSCVARTAPPSREPRESRRERRSRSCSNHPRPRDRRRRSPRAWSGRTPSHSSPTSPPTFSSMVTVPARRRSATACRPISPPKEAARSPRPSSASTWRRPASCSSPRRSSSSRPSMRSWRAGPCGSATSPRSRAAFPRATRSSRSPSGATAMTRAACASRPRGRPRSRACRGLQRATGVRSSSSSWERDGGTRFACTWRASAFRSWATPCTEGSVRTMGLCSTRGRSGSRTP